MAARNIAGPGLQPQLEANPAAVIYFIPFIMVGWMFLPKVRGPSWGPGPLCVDWLADVTGPLLGPRAWPLALHGCRRGHVQAAPPDGHEHRGAAAVRTRAH
jgi:hypothetical protein